MSTESIQFALRERFAAPLPEFHNRRIIFWQDEDREFEDILNEIDLPGVNIVKLTGTNNFAVKKLLSHDDLTGDYLVYNPIVYEKPQDDWLRDIEHYSEEFRADFYSILMGDLNIEPSPVMRKTVKMYAAFFANKERVGKLKKIGREYHNPLSLHTDIMAVLAGLNGGTAQDVIIAVLSAGLDEENNSALNNIKKFGNIDAFWELARKYTGYVYDEDKPLGFFASHVLMTALSQTMKASALKGLERFISDTNKPYCYSLVHEWRGGEGSEALLNLCRTVERELQLSARFDKQDFDVLLMGDIFPAIHESVIKKLLSEASEGMTKPERVLKAVENRRISGWSERFTYYYDCLYYVAKMQEFYMENAGEFQMVNPEEIWKFYGEKAYEMDSFYRKFHFAFGCSLKNSNPVLEDRLKQAADYIERLYKNWFISELMGCWTKAAAGDFSSIGYVSGIDRQRDFYDTYVKPAREKNRRVFVVISDALRYEVATELAENIMRTTGGTADLQMIQGIFPSITKFGMAALLPGKNITLDDNMDVHVDGMSTRSTGDRERILCAENPDSIAVSYADILNMKRAERREIISGKNVVYIYHNTIDAVGDRSVTEGKVFEACEETLQELSNLLRIIVNDMQGTEVFITADHGFLYTYSPVVESEKVSKAAFLGEVYESGRRYALTPDSTECQLLMQVAMDTTINGAGLKGYTPWDATRIKTAGGGENYVHGGTSLQEICVPVISFRNVRTTSKSYVEVTDAELKLLSESRKISNLLFSLDFFQSQPVGDKIQPCTYTLYFTDDMGTVVSDRQTVIADRTRDNASERVFRVRFSLKSISYDNKKTYRLIISNGSSVPEEIEFNIDVAFADDFGFDF